MIENLQNDIRLIKKCVFILIVLYILLIISNFIPYDEESEILVSDAQFEELFPSWFTELQGMQVDEVEKMDSVSRQLIYKDATSSYLLVFDSKNTLVGRKRILPSFDDIK